MTVPTSRTKVFISYCHNDKEWLQRLQVHLKPLIREGLEMLDDTQIKPGPKWVGEIRNALDSASVAILLMTADFLTSDYIANTESRCCCVPQKKMALLFRNNGVRLQYFC